MLPLSIALASFLVPASAGKIASAQGAIASNSSFGIRWCDGPGMSGNCAVPSNATLGACYELPDFFAGKPHISFQVRSTVRVVLRFMQHDLMYRFMADCSTLGQDSERRVRAIWRQSLSIGHWCI